MLRNRTLLAVSFVVCAAFTGIGMVGPVRVLYARSLGASLTIISAMASAYLISNFAAQYPAGWIADRWGRKQIMLVGLLAQAALSAVYLIITDPTSFVVLRFVEGIAAAAVLPSARALIADTVEPERQGQAYGLFGAFLNAGFLIGPALGGLLASASYASAFIGAVAFRLVAVVIVLLFVPTTRPISVAARQRSASVPRRALLRLPLLGVYLLAFGDYLYLGFDISLMPLWMHDHLGATVALIGLAYTVWAVPGIVIAPLGGHLADRRRRSWLILIFGLAQVPIYAVYGLANVAWIVVVLFGIHSVVYSFIQPAVDAHLAASSPAAARGRVQGFYSSVGLLGAFVGATLFTPLYALNFRLPLFTIGAAYGTCVLIGGLMVRRSESRRLSHLAHAPEPLPEAV